MLPAFQVHCYINVKQSDAFPQMHTTPGAQSAVLQVDSPLCSGCCVGALQLPSLPSLPSTVYTHRDLADSQLSSIPSSLVISVPGAAAIQSMAPVWPIAAAAAAAVLDHHSSLGHGSRRDHSKHPACSKGRSRTWQFCCHPCSNLTE